MRFPFPPRAVPPSILLALVLLFLAATGGLFYRHTRATPVLPDFADEIKRWRKTPLIRSPDGRLVIYNTNSGQYDYGLEIRNVADGTTLASVLSDVPMLRVRWSPDGSQVCYFSPGENDTDRRCFIWDHRRNQIRNIPVPRFKTQPQVTWSPDGLSIATATNSNNIVVIPVDAHEPSIIPARSSSFAWCGDSKRLMFVQKETDRLFMADVATKVITPVKAGLLGNGQKSLQSYSTQEVLVCEYDEKMKRSVLVRMNTDTFEETLLTATEGQAELALATNEAVMWAFRKNNGPATLVLERLGDKTRMPLDLGGDAMRQTINAEDGTIDTALFSCLRNDIVQVGSLDRKARVVAAGPRPEGSGLIEENIQIERHDGSRCVLSSARPQVLSEKSCAVVRMHPHDRMDYEGTWAQMQTLLDHGVVYINIVNDGVHGVEDILAACRYIESRWHISRDRVVVTGCSKAGSVVMAAALTSPDVMSAVVLIGIAVPPRMPLQRQAVDRRLRIWALHGEFDQPDKARAYIDAMLGPRALSSRQGTWYLSSKEGHTLYRGEGVAVAYILGYFRGI